MADVKYTEYTLAEQDKVPKVYREYLRQKTCAAGLDNVPIIIWQVWEFDFDEDGKNEAFIIADNYLPWFEYDNAHDFAEAEQLQTLDGIGYYSYALFYSETYLPIDFEATTVLMHDSFFPSSDQAPGAIYEYDQNGHIQLFSIYSDSEFDSEMEFPIIHTLGLIVCDVNNDDRYDFIISHEPIRMCVPYELYLQSADGDFIRVGGMYTSA